MADNRKELALAVLAMKLIERGLAFVLDGCVLEVLGKEICRLQICGGHIDKAVSALRTAVDAFSCGEFAVQAWSYKGQVYLVITPLESAQIDLFEDKLESLVAQIRKARDCLAMIADAAHPIISGGGHPSIIASPEVCDPGTTIVRGSEILVSNQKQIDDARAVIGLAKAHPRDINEHHRVSALVECRDFSKTGTGESIDGMLVAVDTVDRYIRVRSASTSAKVYRVRVKNSKVIRTLASKLLHSIVMKVRVFTSIAPMGGSTRYRYELVEFTDCLDLAVDA